VKENDFIQFLLNLRSFVEDSLDDVVGIRIVDMVNHIESVNEKPRTSESASLNANEKATSPEIGRE